MKLSDLLEILGFICFVLFALCIWPPAALAVAGVELVFLGYSFSQQDVNLVGALVSLHLKHKARRAAKKVLAAAKAVEQ